jgi:hypothetical protein
VFYMGVSPPANATLKYQKLTASRLTILPTP